MKRKLAAVLAGTMICAVALSGCGNKNVVSNEYINLVGYKGIEVPAVDKVEEITEKDIDNYINTMLNRNSTAEEITDRPVEVGDTVSIDFVGKMNGEEFEGGSSEDYPLEIGSGAFIPGFEDSIIGHEIGDTFDWNGQFPENYNPEMAGKDVTFTITVNSIMVYSFPELNDEFVQSNSTTSKTVEEYREEVKGILEEEAKLAYEQELQESVYNAVLDNTEVIAYPEGEVEATMDAFREQYEAMAEAYGMSYEELLESQNYSVEMFEQEIKVASEQRVKLTLIVNTIAEAEGLMPTEEEFEEAYQILLDQYGYEDMDQLIQAAGGEEELKTIVVQNIVLEWLTDNCIQVND